MAGFLRRKSKADQTNPNPNQTPRTSTSALAVPPLYARFASTSAKQDDPTTVSRPMVSGPMSLASARKMGPGSPPTPGQGHGHSKGQSVDDRRLMNGNGKRNGTGYDVRAQIGNSNTAAPGNGHSTMDRYAASSTDSRAGPSVQPRKGYITPSSASRVSLDKTSPASLAMAESHTLFSVSSIPPGKDSRLSKSLTPTRPNSFLIPPEDKPLPVPDTDSPTSISQHSSLNLASRQAPDLSFLSFADSPYLDIQDKESPEFVLPTTPRYPPALTQHLLSKVEKELPPQPVRTPSGGSDALTPDLKNQAASAPRATESPPSKKSQFSSFSRISLSRSSQSKTRRQNTQSTSTSGHIPRISLDRPPHAHEGFESSSGAMLSRTESRVPSGPRLPIAFGNVFKTKDKGKGGAQMDNSKETLGDSTQSVNKTTHIASVHSHDTSESLPRKSSQHSADTIASGSPSSSIAQLAQSHHQRTSSGDLRPPSAQERNITRPTASSGFSTNSAGIVGSSVHQNLHYSVPTPSDPSPQSPTRASIETRREPPKSSDPHDLNHRTTSTHLRNPPRRSDSLPGTENKGIDYFAPNPTLTPTSPFTQQQEGRRAPGSSPSHVRQPSAQLRRGPLIFAATADPEVTPPVNEFTLPNSSRAQPVAQDPERLRSMHDNNSVRAGLEAYPSSPTESVSVIDGSHKRAQRSQRPPSTDFERNFSSDRPAQDNRAMERQPQIQTPQPSPQPQSQPPQVQPHLTYRPLSQNQSFPSQLPRRQIPHAEVESQAQQQSQTHVRPQHSNSSTVSQYPNGHNRTSSDTQSKSRHVLTKARASAIPRPTTPPISSRKPGPPTRLDPSVDFNDQTRRRSGVPSNANHATSGLDYTHQAKPSAIALIAANASSKDIPATQPSKHDLDGVPDFDPEAMKGRTRASVDHDVNANLPPTPKSSPSLVSPEEHLREQFRRWPSEPQPQVLDTSAISQQATSAGPYDPVFPRVRPRPMTVFSMTAFSLNGFLSDAGLLFNLLSYLTFYDWIVLSNVSKQIRAHLQEDRDLREEALERYLDTIGYERWTWEQEEPLSLSLQDLNDYMRGVSMPNHQYARLAEQCLELWKSDPMDKFAQEILQVYTASTRAYTRIVLRLRAQAEAAEAEYVAQQIVQASSSNGPVSAFSMANGNFSSNQSRSYSRPPSRAPSPAMSMFSSAHHTQTAVNHTTGSAQANTTQHRGASFRSPLFKLRRAPLLRVFVPSPDGDWLSDASVLECEAQLKAAGVLKLLRSGDVVWDVAVGDESNIGRLVWDRNFLIDLDYSYSRAGDLPQYLHTLAFPPSYFHRVIRTSPANSSYGSNPIVHIDISPWGEEVAANLQLLQDRMRTETPQGSHHNVVRWVHRSSFVIRPPPVPITARYGPNRTRIPSARVPIPQTDKLFVDPGWHGTIVVEAEGTNEGLADLQERCGNGVFPPRARAVIRNPGGLKPRDGRKVFRLLREKSRPGEIWLRTVGEKERLM